MMGRYVYTDRVTVAFERMVGGLPDDPRGTCDDPYCSRIPHEGDHFDAATERRWHNHGCQAYGAR